MLYKTGVFLCLIVLLAAIAAAEDNSSIGDAQASEIPAEEPANESAAIPEQPGLLKTFLDMFLEKLSFIKGEIVKVRTYLTYENNSPVVSEPVEFYANNEKIGGQDTDDSGIAEFSWDTSAVMPGTYSIEAKYTGNGIIQSSYDSNEITIKENAEETITGSSDNRDKPFFRNDRAMRSNPRIPVDGLFPARRGIAMSV